MLDSRVAALFMTVKVEGVGHGGKPEDGGRVGGRIVVGPSCRRGIRCTWCSFTSRSRTTISTCWEEWEPFGLVDVFEVPGPCDKSCTA